MIRLELDDCPGPAKRLPDRALRALVTDALEAHQREGDQAATAGVDGPRPGVTAARSSASRSRARAWGQRGSGRSEPGAAVWLRRALLVVASLGMVGGVSAAVTHVVRGRMAGPVAPAIPMGSGRPASSRAVPPSLARAVPPASSRAVPPSLALAPQETPAPPPAPRHRDLSAGLAAANELRASHRWAEAARAYASFAARATGGEASTAAVAAASLELEHLRHARRARQLYTRALADPMAARAVAEEAHWGLALCARSLGEEAAEAKALRVFMEAHPGSVWRAEAEARLYTLAPDRRAP